MRISQAARRRKVTDALVAPGGIKRMLAKRHELDVGEAHVVYVVHKLLREFAVRQPPVPLLRDPPPRSQVDLVDRHGRPVKVTALAPQHPIVVAPAEAT